MYKDFDDGIGDWSVEEEKLFRHKVCQPSMHGVTTF
jgi:hypothetical protein